MYLVVSRWEMLPGNEEDFAREGIPVREALRKEPGVVFMEGFKADDGAVVVVHGYKDEATYQNIVHNPNSAFNRALENSKLESYGHWVSTDKGETIED